MAHQNKNKPWLKPLLIFAVVFALGVTAFLVVTRTNVNTDHKVGDVLDELNGVPVYFNGGVGNVEGRNLSKDGYNLGLKYQCVEFVKRYYYDHYQHRMPDSYGHAKSFFKQGLKDGEMNNQRNLYQYTNPSVRKPAVGDLVVFDGTLSNRYGHVAIVSNVTDTQLEIIQQNPGPFGKSRVTFLLVKAQGKWKVGSDTLMGWLSLDKPR